MSSDSSDELLYVKGERVWIPHAENVWESVTIEQNYKKGDKEILTKKDSGNNYIIKLEKELPPLCNPGILSGQRNLVSLSYLHEPAVLHNLEVRFRDRQNIYTYCGIVLVAINPYADLPLYGPDIIRSYRGHSHGDLDPHIFAVADEAYAKLEREKSNISIIISGESGAGKTVSAKYAMRYFAAVGGSESETKIERKVLASSPIMEAIGNAKTTKNDNSSRFGKFTKLLFRNKNQIMSLGGASMQTYLLEKSRVVFQSTDERNYHIFYQLCSGRKDFPELRLDSANNFNYLNQGGSTEIYKVSDLEQFRETMNAFTTLGFKREELYDILRMLSGILHLGNVDIVSKGKTPNEADQDACDISVDNSNLKIVSELFEINTMQLRQYLITRQIESGCDIILIPNDVLTAETRRDALAKHLYERLFHYIVYGINKALNKNKELTSFIGVLDIYGFEAFESNSFEQFCINYANEKLQQQFNQHVFKLEQDEYLKEGITWTMIDFYDNQPCIDLIESRLGILDLLDEECKMPKGSDSSWADKLVDKCSKYPHFEKPRFGKKSFMIKHFSDTVEYDVNGFLEKNKDTVSKELVNVFYKSKIKLCQTVLEYDPINYLNDFNTESNEIVKSRPKQHKKTVGFQFRENLSALISTLHLTIPNYVRCIKPNENKDPFKWESKKIVQQLRACGVLETVRISAAGFPSRWFYVDFYERYRLLYTAQGSLQRDLNKRCIEIIRTYIPDADKYRFGKKKIFFRAGQVAYLEQIRSNLRKKYIITVQSVVRRFVYRKRYLKLKKTTLGIQTYSRGLLARRKAQSKRENRAATVIQKTVRGWLCRNRYLKLQKSIAILQKYARGSLARRRFKLMIENYNATIIQKYFRGYRARKEYKRKLKQIVLVQSIVRAYLAKKVFRKIKAEARTISHIQKQYKGLENKIISLQQTIDDLNKENNLLKTRNMEIPNLRSQLELKKKLEDDLRNLKSILSEKDLTLNAISKNLEIERDEKMILLEEKDHDYNEWYEQKQTWRIENDELRKVVSNMVELAKNNQLKSKPIKKVAKNNEDEIHHAYQRALKDNEILESENLNLLDEIKRLRESEKENHLIEANIMKQNEEDMGYASAKNTLNLKKLNGTSDSDKHTTSLLLRLKKLHEDEKNRRIFLEKQVERVEKKKTKSNNTFPEDSFRISELEMENDKLRHDHEALRSSITHNKGVKELEDQYVALQQELRRQRDESIQLKSVLLEQSKLLGSFNNNNGDGPVKIDSNEPTQALKQINRQLEAELLALNQENNARLEDLIKQIDLLKIENDNLNKVMYNKIDNAETLNVEDLKQVEKYLRIELEKCISENISLQEQNNELSKTVDDLTCIKNSLKTKLKSFGVTEDVLEEESKSLVPVKKKAKKYQGAFKYARKDINAILKKLVTELVPRTALLLLPGLPAYILFMCIRYTDLVNDDDQVGELLTRFLMLTKPAYRKPNTTEVRILWLVNMITLLNLLQQYGGLEEYGSQNTETQNQQQLQHFDLSEYRGLMYETILKLYSVLVQQIQEIIKPAIVPAILDHNEILEYFTQNKMNSLDKSPKHLGEPKLLTHHLEHFYKQFQFFGLSSHYINQIFKQLMYYICAVAMNRLMLRGELCMWKTGMKIRYSYRCLEEWTREKSLPKEVLAPMAPLNQVSSLLQTRKNEDDVDSAFELCTSLSTAQVHKVLKSFRPNDPENSISKIFVEKLIKKLDANNERKTKNDIFTIDENYVNALNVSFDFSKIKLEDIELPTSLHLNEFLCKI